MEKTQPKFHYGTVTHIHNFLNASQLVQLFNDLSLITGTNILDIVHDLEFFQTAFWNLDVSIIRCIGRKGSNLVGPIKDNFGYQEKFYHITYSVYVKYQQEIRTEKLP